LAIIKIEELLKKIRRVFRQIVDKFSFIHSLEMIEKMHIKKEA